MLPHHQDFLNHSFSCLEYSGFPRSRLLWCGATLQHSEKDRPWVKISSEWRKTLMLKWSGSINNKLGHVLLGSYHRPWNDKLRWSIRVKIRITLELCKNWSRQQPARHPSYATLPLLAGLKQHQIISTCNLMIHIFYACQMMLNKFGLAGLRVQFFGSLDEFLISNVPVFQQVTMVDGHYLQIHRKFHTCLF